MGKFNFRRDVLKGGATGVAGLSTLMPGTVGAKHEGPSDSTVRFDDQQSGGGAVTISTVRTRRTSVLFVVTDSFEVLAREILPGRRRRTEYEISLSEPTTATQELDAILIERPGRLVAGDSATVTIGDTATALTLVEQSSDGDSVEISHLRTDVDASLFVFDGAGEEIGGEGVRFVAGTELESLTVPLAEPLSGSQSVRVVLYESNGGPVAEAEAFVEVADAGPATLAVEDQASDGTAIDVSYVWSGVDSSLFVFDEDGDTIGGSGVTFDAGQEVSGLTVDLAEPLESDRELTVKLYESNGGPIAERTVSVDVTGGSDPSLVVEDQATDGSTVTVASLRTDVDASLFVFDAEGGTIGGSGVTFDAGDEVTSLPVDLEEPLETSQDVTVKLYESNGGPIAEDTATVTVT